MLGKLNMVLHRMWKDAAVVEPETVAKHLFGWTEVLGEGFSDNSWSLE
jgi:hypothetical protein